ncbi:MAG TPA: 40S ribosomal protein S3a/S1 [Nitrososphaeraceae archaeon]|nr:40S ribosomal protein S3a/S1 [Nitrososphaeraceae archaeon]
MAKGGKKAGRVRDKWRDKQWVIVNSPPAFGSVPLNYVPITAIETSKGRVIENTMYDILRQDPTQHQTKVFVQIQTIRDGIASTIFKGHEYAKEFLRSLVRRGSSMISHTHDYTTSDGYTFRVVMIAFSQKRINSSKRHEIRILTHRLLAQRIPQLTVDQFVQEVTMGKMGADLLSETKKVASLRHIGIRKTKLISTPQSAIESTAVTLEQVASSQDSETREVRLNASVDK